MLRVMLPLFYICICSLVVFNVLTFQNRPADWKIGGTVPGMKDPKKEELDDTPEGAMGENPITGRQKVMDIQNAAIDDSETATRNPPL